MGGRSRSRSPSRRARAAVAAVGHGAGQVAVAAVVASVVVAGEAVRVAVVVPAAALAGIDGRTLGGGLTSPFRRPRARLTARSPACLPPETGLCGQSPRSNAVISSRRCDYFGEVSLLLRRGFFNEGLKQVPGGGSAPVAGALDAAEESALAIDEVGGGRAPDAVELAGHVTGGVQEHGGSVPAFVGDLLHGVGILAEADQQDFETFALELPVQPIDGR